MAQLLGVARAIGECALHFAVSSTSDVTPQEALRRESDQQTELIASAWEARCESRQRISVVRLRY